jgi:CDGSH-type Zn-finger protein
MAPGGSRKISAGCEFLAVSRSIIEGSSRASSDRGMRTKESPALSVRNGPLAVKPLRNGPLMIQGSLELVSGTTETFLCRCGAWSNKPFCDGTHKKIGFTVEGSERAKSPAAP